VVIAVGGGLDAVNVRTGQITNLSRTLGTTLPHVFQLAMRSVPAS
jgi:hypothetical protein